MEMGVDRLRLTRVERGVTNAARTAEFYTWLLDLVPEEMRRGSFRLPLANGELLLHDNTQTPVAFELFSAGPEFRGPDPDGVPVVASSLLIDQATQPVALDHVRLNCADLAEAIRFYREFGFRLTWSGCGDMSLEGLQTEPIAGADWVHLSGVDGYLSLSQADWLDYGAHSTASGPPRFIHIGLAVTSMASVVARLDNAGIEYIRGPQDGLGERLYLNDPDGDPHLGTNLELNQYEPNVQRSGRL